MEGEGRKRGERICFADVNCRIIMRRTEAKVILFCNHLQIQQSDWVSKDNYCENRWKDSV